MGIKIIVLFIIVLPKLLNAAITEITRDINAQSTEINCGLIALRNICLHGSDNNNRIEIYNKDELSMKELEEIAKNIGLVCKWVEVDYRNICLIKSHFIVLLNNHYYLFVREGNEIVYRNETKCIDFNSIADIWDGSCLVFDNDINIFKELNDSQKQKKGGCRVEVTIDNPANGRSILFLCPIDLTGTATFYSDPVENVGKRDVSNEITWEWSFVSGEKGGIIKNVSNTNSGKHVIIQVQEFPEDGPIEEQNVLCKQDDKKTTKYEYRYERVNISSKITKVINSISFSNEKSIYVIVKGDLGGDKYEDFNGFDGKRKHGKHRAQDIRAPIGTDINCYEGGTIAATGTAATGGDLGNFIMIKTGNHYHTYAHMQSPPTQTVNQRISTGEFIGKVDKTGNAECCYAGPHLHTDKRSSTTKGGRYYDPVPDITK